MHSNYSNVQYKSYCILKYKNKTWLHNCEVTYCDRCHVSVKKALKLIDDECKSLTAVSLTTTLSSFHFSQKVQKRCDSI